MLRRALLHPAPLSVARERTVALGSLYALGAVLGLVTIALAPAASPEVLPLAVTFAVGFPVAGAILVVGQRLASWLFHPLLASGTAIIAFSCWLSGPGTTMVTYAAALIWVALYAGYFFSLAAAAIHVSFAIVSYAVVLSVLGQPFGVEVTGLAGVMVVVAGVTNWLSNVRSLSQIDPLTGVANRRGLDLILHDVMIEASAHDTALAVGMLDLDDFRHFNEVRGRAAGDRLLTACVVAWRRELPDGVTLTRFDGDEFVVVLPGYGLRAAREVLDGLRQTVPRPHTCSAGVAAWVPGDTQSLLLARADTALYGAKQDGRNRVNVLGDDSEVATELLTAIDAGELEVDYQPIYSLPDGRLSGVEALVRWRHPERGLLPPLDFIDVAERTGVIHALGRFVIDTACEQLSRWRGDAPDAAALTMAINVSPVQLEHPRLAGDLRHALERFELPPDSIVIEITESALTDDETLVGDLLWRLRRTGVRLAMDDFGTGHSSLARLRELPFDILKIDRAFVSTIGDDGDALLEAIVGVSRSLGLETVAEGVETPRQLRFVADYGCTRAQGFLLGRPQAADAIGALLSAGGRVPITAGATAIPGNGEVLRLP